MRPSRVLVGLAASFALSGCFSAGDLSSVPLTTQVTDWRDETIYQVIVDRFADGDMSNDYNVNRASLGRYQGGDWQGIIDHLDYFQALGVTTLWISPIIRNIDSDSGFDGYHGYWASDLAELNPHFGDLTTLRSLVQQAHQRHLRIVLDIVVNHMGQLFYYDVNQNGQPDDDIYGGGQNDTSENPGGESQPIQQINEYDPPYNDNGVIQSFSSLGPAGPAPIIFLNQPGIYRVPPGWSRACDPTMTLQLQPSCNSWQQILAEPDGYHRRGEIVEYINTNDQPDPEVMLGDFPGGLKDVATERDDVRAAMIQAYSRWVEMLDLDGFRIDTVKHVEHAFWSTFGPAVRSRLAAEGKNDFLMFGEAFDGDDTLIGSYTETNELDSMVYFSQKYQVFQDVFQCENPTQEIQSLFAQREMNYSGSPQPNGVGVPATQLLVDFMDNHDVPRFLAGNLDSDPTVCTAGRVNTDADFQNMRLKLLAALTFLYTEDGIPVLYYGTEQDFRGANDPANREVFWETATDYATNGDSATQFPTSGQTFLQIARLTRIRSTYPALRHGSFDFKWTTTRSAPAEDAGMIAFERNTHASDAIVLVAINAQSGGTSHTEFSGSAMPVSFPPGTLLVDVLAASNPRTFTVAPDGTLVVDLMPWEAVILVPQAQVLPLPM